MGVVHETVGDGLATHGIEQRRNVRLVERTGIDDGDLTATDNIGDRPSERERTRIVGKQPANPGRDLFHLAGRKTEAFVERNVITHARGHFEFCVSRTRCSNAVKLAQTAYTSLRRGAPLIRDRSRLGARNGRGSAAHRCALLRAGPGPGHDLS